MFLRLRTHIENPKLPKHGFLVDCIMNMGSFPEVGNVMRALCVKLLSWNEKKKAVTNLKNDEE